MKCRKLSYEPLYQPCWISYLGSVSGIMKAYGKEEHDLINTGGITGYAFALPNIFKGISCPSGPTSLGKMWELIFEGTLALGFKIEIYEDRGCFPSTENIITPEDRERAVKIFDIVKKSINKNEAVVLWGIPNPEYGIITGYQDDQYLASTFRRIINLPEEPTDYDKLQAPGNLHAITITMEKSEVNDKKSLINRAITLATGELTAKKYVAGIAAYEEWANILENAPADKSFYHGNSYVGECTLEAKTIAGEFLNRLAKEDPSGEVTNSLLASAREYENIADLLRSFTKLFPFAFQGELSSEIRVEGAKILRRIIPYENRALMFLKSAYESLM